jgi:hypothetical protein
MGKRRKNLLFGRVSFFSLPLHIISSYNPIDSFTVDESAERNFEHEKVFYGEGWKKSWKEKGGRRCSCLDI